MHETKPAYASKTVWGGVIALCSPVLIYLGVSLTPALSADLAEILATLGSAIGGLLAIYGRLVAHTTITKVER